MSEQDEIIYAEIVEGDYNDVYSRKNVKGTWAQIEEYVKSYFTEEGLEKAEDMSSDGLTLGIYEEYEDREEDEEYDHECYLEYYVDAMPYVNDEKPDDVIDLGED